MSLALTLSETGSKGMQTIPRLDLMIAYSCNISCVGCISLSNFKRDGIASIDEITDWIAHWGTLVSPEVVTLFGGEPCLHPKLLEICELVRLAWPSCTIRLITNGYLLDNFDSDSWFKYGKFEMQISIHRKDHEAIINKKIKSILAHKKKWIPSKSMDNGHQQLTLVAGDFKLYKSIFKDFVVPFKGRIEPWNSNPADAHKICGAPNTPILFKGKLYKCPPVANAMDLSKQNWFDYTPCSDTSTLDSFIAGIGVPEPVCGQCPNKQQAVIINHFDITNVSIKQKNIS